MSGFRILLLIVPLFILGLFPGAAQSDGDVVITQLRTNAEPGVAFDSVVVDLHYGAALVGEVTHPVAPGEDYERGVRISEWTLGSGFDSGVYIGTMSLKLGGVVVASRPYRVELHHGHPHASYAGDQVVHITTVLIAHLFEPIEVATKSVSLEDDRDSSGSISSGDQLRYTTTFESTHDIGHGSSYRDDLDPDLKLVPGSVTTTHGVVFRGNLPSDSEIDVRFGPVANGQSVTISYLADVDPLIENQGVLTLKLAGTVYDYELLTDNPDTVEVDDPTVVALACSPGEPPVLPTETISLFPPLLSQFGVGQLVVRGEGFGTGDGNPSFMMNQQTVEAISHPADGNTETVTIPLTPEMYEIAGAIPWTITPVNQQLPPVDGSIDVEPAPELPEHVGAFFANAISERIGAQLMHSLDDYRRARDRTFADPVNCADIRNYLVSDMGHSAEFAENQIMALGLTAMQQAAQTNATPSELAEIMRITGDGVIVLNEMMSHLQNTLGAQSNLSWCEGGTPMFSDGFEAMAQIYNDAIRKLNETN